MGHCLYGTVYEGGRHLVCGDPGGHELGFGERGGRGLLHIARPCQGIDDTGLRSHNMRSLLHMTDMVSQFDGKQNSILSSL